MKKRITISAFLLIFFTTAQSFSAENNTHELSFQHQGRRLALVVGNWDYKQVPLDNPKNDSSDIALALKALGFDVIYKKNVTRKSFRAAVRQFGNQLYNYNVGLFYYAGHGLQVNGTNYLIPVGADIYAEDEVQDETVEAELILRKMRSAGNFLNIVILDACRNNPFKRSFRSVHSGLARMDAPKGSLIAYSTAPGSVASDGKGRNSPYTKHLLSNMVMPGIPVEKIFKRVRIGLSMETGGKQISWESSSLMGDFYFAKLKDTTQPLTGMVEINIEGLKGDLFVDNNKVSFKENERTAFVTLLLGWHTITVKKNGLNITKRKVFITADNVKYISGLNKLHRMMPAEKKKYFYRSIKKRRVLLPPP